MRGRKRKGPSVAKVLILVGALAQGAGEPQPHATESPSKTEDEDIEGEVVTISGTVTDAHGAMLEGVTIRVSGATEAMTMTAADGTYGITASNCASKVGSWFVEPSLPGCVFATPRSHLDRLSDHTTVDFTAASEGCRGSRRPVDPGPRPGPPGAGGPALQVGAVGAREAAAVACIRGLSPQTLLLCEQAFLRFQEVDSISGTIPGEEGAGLGPSFNGNSCAMCHSQPAVLGTSPAPFSPQRPLRNPQIALAVLDGARNGVPPFITADGPVRAARFKDDGDVHELFTIAGRSDARACNQAQPDFARNIAMDNVSFRIPLALFGLGLVEAVSDGRLRENVAASRSTALGISGVLNRSRDDGTVTRFGWKAQDRSLLGCAAAAYAVEIGVTNELFPEERAPAPGCTLNGVPEDVSDPSRTGSKSDTSTDVENFALAVRLSAPPEPANPPGVSDASVESGRDRFVQVGCANCHTPTLTTSTSNMDPKMSKMVIHPYSDFALHHMGRGLDDGVTQGWAGPDQFRTTPLWGLGQRLFFLHDGRSASVVDAIAAHAGSASEADVAVGRFDALSLDEQQDVLNFLRSL